MNDLRRVVAAGAGEHRHAPPGLLDEELHDPHALGVGQRGVLARRAARHEKMNAGVDLPTAETAHGCLVEFPERVNGVTTAVPTPVQLILITPLRQA